jgi:hypothetical protein
MAVPHVSGAFGDLLDVDFEDIFNDTYDQLEDKVSMLYTMVPHNGQNHMRWSEIGTVPDFSEFTGQVEYQSQEQGYDVQATYVEFTNGIQVRRKLYDDDQYHVMNERPKGLATSAMRTRQQDAFRIFNESTSTSSSFFTNSEGVALVSSAHTTNAPVSTASGFDNSGTAALTATAVQASRIAMRGFRDDQAGRMSVSPDELFYPPDLFAEAEEIIGSPGAPEDASNRINVNKSVYSGYDCEYLNDANNWFMCDGAKRKEMLFWVDRVPLEFGMAEEFDTFIAKWRAYMRYSFAYTNWRWIYGNIV